MPQFHEPVDPSLSNISLEFKDYMKERDNSRGRGDSLEHELNERSKSKSSPRKPFSSGITEEGEDGDEDARRRERERERKRLEEEIKHMEEEEIERKAKREREKAERAEREKQEQEDEERKKKGKKIKFCS